jgi:hypothetical protein
MSELRPLKGEGELTTITISISADDTWEDVLATIESQAGSQNIEITEESEKAIWEILDLAENQTTTLPVQFKILKK